MLDTFLNRQTRTHTPDTQMTRSELTQNKKQRTQFEHGCEQDKGMIQILQQIAIIIVEQRNTFEYKLTMEKGRERDRIIESWVAEGEETREQEKSEGARRSRGALKHDMCGN